MKLMLEDIRRAFIEEHREWLREPGGAVRLHLHWLEESGLAADPYFEVTIAAATAVLGFDMFRDEPWTVSDVPRVITGLAVTGSAAAGDSGVDLLVGTVRVLRKYNTTTGFPTMDHLQELEALVLAGAKISCPVFDAPATNPLNVLLGIEELG